MELCKRKPSGVYVEPESDFKMEIPVNSPVPLLLERMTTEPGSTAAVPVLPRSPERLPSLDGLRALSIALVVIGHAAATMPPMPSWLSAVMCVVSNGELGVAFFFVISGYLITHLLLRELAATGTISFHNFYVRRVTRIFPAFYTYLAILVALAACGYVNVHAGDFLASGCFLWNYLPMTSGWWLGQTWSLSVEEQFYLLWPVTLFLLGPRKAAWLAILLIALEPVVRVVSYFLWPSYRGRIPVMLHTRADILMFGCVIALFDDNAILRTLLDRLARPAAMTTICVFLFVIDPVLAGRYHGAYVLPVGCSLEGAAIAVIVAALMRHPGSRAGRMFNLRPVVWFGLISYSLYLWQQMFLTPRNLTIAGRFPLNVFATTMVAAASYYCIERPVLRMRPRFLRPTRRGFKGTSAAS
jgi:peptidoglycan/LPS O-acetylase OafA/YrhL